LIIVGNAIDNRAGTVEIEGSGTDGTAVVSARNYQVLYSGGTTNTDNSGTLTYVRVEFAGYAPSLNNELNAFTFAAVGSGTRLSYLQSMGGLDDAFEFFGGASTPITSLRTRRATTCSTCRKDSRAPVVPHRLQLGATDAALGRRLARDGPRRHRE
jgi:hypothetical protein